jgi:hypothetical protein
MAVETTTFIISFILVVLCAGTIFCIYSNRNSKIEDIQRFGKKKKNSRIREARQTAKVTSTVISLITVALVGLVHINLVIGDWFRNPHELKSVEIQGDRFVATEYDWSLSGRTVADLPVTQWISYRTVRRSEDPDLLDKDMAQATGATDVSHDPGMRVNGTETMRFAVMNGEPVILVPDNCRKTNVGEWSCSRIAVIKYQREGIYPSESIPSEDMVSWCTPDCTEEQLAQQIGAKISSDGKFGTTYILTKPGEPSYRVYVAKSPFYKALIKAEAEL